MEYPFKMDDLGVPLFSETPIYFFEDFFFRFHDLHKLGGYLEVMRKHAANKRIIWLSCSAQSGLASVTRFSQMQAVRGRVLLDLVNWGRHIDEG